MWNKGLDIRSRRTFPHDEGWESQLLETGFLGIFLVPWVSLSRFPMGSPPPDVCIWGYRWLLFRVMVRALQYRHLVVCLVEFARDEASL